MAEGVLSRRDFLKLLGYGAVALTLAPIVNLGGLKELKKLFPPSSPSPAFAQTSGSWALGQNTTSVAIHAAMMPSGRIFYLAGSGYHRDRPNGPFDARILDLNTGSERNLPLTEDLFCIGITHLANGNVLMAGGTLMYDKYPDNCSGDWYGLNSTYEVDAQSENLVWTTNMAHGRWYPSLVTLPDGKAVVVNGLDEYGSFNLLVEIYDPLTKTWSKKFNPGSSAIYCAGKNVNGTLQCKPGAGSVCHGGPNNGNAPNIGQYPRMHLMPSGLVITCGGQAQTYSWNPADGRWNKRTLTNYYRHYGASFLLPLHNSITERGKILLVAGSPPTPPGQPEPYALNAVELLDFDQGSDTNPVLRQVAPISIRRKMTAPVILPNGKCVIFGGSEKGNNIPVRIPEMFDPVTETWESLPSATVNRVYHQVSLLLPDGRVWTAGSTAASGLEENRTEIFSPSYLFQGPRPTIIAMPNVGAYGGTINILTPDAANISSVSLVRLMSATHHYEANQRLIWLQIVNRGLADITVSAPINANIAPPGFYMIHVLNGIGVPSVAKIIQIPGAGTGIGGDTTPPSKVMGLTVTPNTGTQLDLAWATNPEPDLNHYNIYRGTTSAFIVNIATDVPVAQPTNNTFSDSGLLSSTTYYYKVAAVDTAGNIGLLSDEVSASTGDVIAPAKILGLIATTISSSRIDLGWTTGIEPDIDHYNVYRGTTAGFPVTPGTDTPLAQPVANSYSDSSGLVESTSYYYKVAAVDTAGNVGVLSDETNTTTGDSTAPSKVMDLAVTTISGSQLDLAWTANAETDLNHYNIYRGTSTGFAVNTTTDTPLSQPLTNSYADTNGLSESTSYYYKVAAVDNAGNIGILSDEASGATTGDTSAPGKVLGLMTSTISSTQIDLSWNSNTEPDLAHYNVYRGTTTGFPVNTSSDTPLSQPIANSYSDNNGLTESITYYYKVAAVDSAGNIGILSDESFAATGDSTAPAKVLDVVATTISSSRIDLAWTTSTEPDLNHYNIYRGTTAGFTVNTVTDTPLGQPSTNTYSDSTNLVESTTYYYKVAAVDNNGNIGILSDEASANTGDSTAPAKVVGLTATTVSSSRIDLGWTSSTEPDVAHYNVYRGTTVGFTVNPATDTPLAQPSASSYSDISGLTDSTTYYYRVAAVDTAGNIGIQSNEVSATAGGIFYDVPFPGNKSIALNSGGTTKFGEAALTASSVLIGKHLRTWKVRLKKLGSPSGLIIARVRKKTPDSVVATFNEAIDSTTLTTAFVEYTFTLTNSYTIQRDDRIMIEYSGPAAVSIEYSNPDKFDGSATGRVTYDTRGYVPGSIDDVTGTMSSLAPVGGDITAPSKVTGLLISPISGSQLNLSWSSNPEPDVTHYNVYRGITSGFIINTSTDNPLAQPTTNSYSDTSGLVESTTYYYRIAAVDNSGNISVPSDEKPGTTLDTVAPSKVLDLTVNPISSNQIDLGWTTNTEPDLSKYKIYRSTTPGFSINFTSDIPIAQPTVNSYSDSDNLSASTTYYYRVVAVDTSGNIGELSDEGSATTAPVEGDTTPPSKVLGIAVGSITANSIDLSWTFNTESDVDHYNVYRGTTAGFAVNSSTIPLGQSATNTYSDTGLPQSSTYYYKVAAVDTSGNKGIVSDEKSGTTLTQIFYNVPFPGNAAGAALNNTTGSLRYGEEAFSTSSILIGKSLKSWKVRLRRSGAPSGMITAKIRKSDISDTVMASFNETIDSTTLGTAYAEYTFTLTNAYTIQKGDRIMVEYGGPASVIIDIWNIDKFDGSNTRRVRYSTTNPNAGLNTEDVAGTMSTV